MTSPLPATLSRKLRKALACPACHEPIMWEEGANPACRKCDTTYALEEGVPLLLKPAAAQQVQADVDHWKNGEIRPPVSYRTIQRWKAPDVHRWDEERKTVQKLLARLPAEALIIDIGSGTSLYADRIVRLELGPYPGIHVAGDAHSLPFTSGSIDAVLIYRVLEHVRQPFEVSREIHRVLRPGGWVSALISFLEPYHANPTDGARFSRDGARELFRDFECESLEWAVGPSVTLAWVLKEYLAILMPLSNHPFVYAALREAAGWMLYPLRGLDKLLRRKSYAHKLATAFHFLGRKP